MLTRVAVPGVSALPSLRPTHCVTRSSGPLFQSLSALIAAWAPVRPVMPFSNWGLKGVQGVNIVLQRMHEIILHELTSHSSSSIGSAPQHMGEKHSLYLVRMPSPQLTLHGLQFSQPPRVTKKDTVVAVVKFWCWKLKWKTMKTCQTRY